MGSSILLSVTQWELSTRQEQERCSLRLAKLLPMPARFERLERCALSNQEHIVALFTVHGVQFALLPGYIGELGFDPERAYVQLLPKSGRAGRGDAEVDALFRDFLTRVLTPPREVILRPFLLETHSVALQRTKQDQAGRTVFVEPIRRSEVAKTIAREGFRFPTSDEWEYATSGGARTLFRWGDALPPERWALPSERSLDAWNKDQQRNAFGLQIGQNPWNLEYCAEEDVMRGGDGGTADAQGAGYAEEWLPLASAFRQPFDKSQVEVLRRPYLRRALTVPEEVWAED